MKAIEYTYKCNLYLTDGQGLNGLITAQSNKPLPEIISENMDLKEMLKTLGKSMDAEETWRLMTDQEVMEYKEDEEEE